MLDKTHAPSTRKQILAAAFKTFLNHGYDGAGLTKIVNESGVSKGAFYHYFATKADIYREVVEAFFLNPFQEFDFTGLAELSSEDARKQLTQYYEHLPDLVHLSTGQDMTRFFALFFESLSRLPSFQRSIAEFYRNLLATLEKCETSRPAAGAGQELDARTFIAGLEGELYLRTIFQTAESEQV